MGRQEGIIPFTGRVGNLSFYKSKLDGYLVRKKSGVSRKRIMTDPRYVRTRENIAEFGRGARATRLVRRAFRSLIRTAADSRVTSRLTSVIMKIIKEDAVNDRGERRVTNDEVVLLQGFEFNKHTALEKTFQAPFMASLDRASGKMVVDIPAFSPDNLISAPGGATHFRLVAIGAAIDFENDTYSTVTSKSADIPIDGKMQEGLRLTKTIAPGSACPLFLVLGIEFLQVVNGESHPLSDGTFNAMSMVRVDGSSQAALTTENIEKTEPVVERDTTTVLTVNQPEVKVPERQRIALPVIRERLLPERLRRPLPAISERLAHERLHRQLTAMGFKLQPPQAGWKLFDDVGLTDSVLSQQRSPIMKDEFG